MTVPGSLWGARKLLLSSGLREFFLSPPIILRNMFLIILFALLIVFRPAPPLGGGLVGDFTAGDRVFPWWTLVRAGMDVKQWETQMSKRKPASRQRQQLRLNPWGEK